MPSVLITGASRGFGRALLDVFAARQWTVFPLVRDAGLAARLCFGHGQSCHPVVADVATEGVGPAIAEVLGRHLGALDLLINNAGSIRKTRGAAAADPADFDEAFQTHCVGALRCVKAALPFLRRSPQATVVNVTSRWGSIARTEAGMGGGIYSYQIAKCAQNMLSACLDQELRPEGIRVFALHPGRLLTAVAAADADTPPEEAAARLADWVVAVDRDAPCGIHDLTGGVL
ncbi:MAG TPA: SDR family NAD(P)-dependent oxidoreductase, partial [Thermoanaerobaculaceae bacterium]|nr:SDR family NAD(P)-dependent oxidoreductase [Thermoanaerobaculaceae bacterium]